MAVDGFMGCMLQISGPLRVGFFKAAFSISRFSSVTGYPRCGPNPLRELPEQPERPHTLDAQKRDFLATARALSRVYCSLETVIYVERERSQLRVCGRQKAGGGKTTCSRGRNVLFSTWNLC